MFDYSHIYHTLHGDLYPVVVQTQADGNQLTVKGLRKIVKRQWGAKHGGMPASGFLETQLVAKVSDLYTEHASAVCTPEQFYHFCACCIWPRGVSWCDISMFLPPQASKLHGVMVDGKRISIV